MEQREKEALQVKLQEKGFPSWLADQVDDDTRINGALIPLKYRDMMGQDIVNYSVFIEFNRRLAQYEIAHFDVSLRKPVDIPKVVVHGIDVAKLEDRMATIDWWTDLPEQQATKRAVHEDLLSLSLNGHPIGIDAQDKLILKYLADTPGAVDISYFAKIRARHEIQRSFRGDSPLQFTANQAYNLLRGRPVVVQVEQDGELVEKWVQSNDLAKDFTGMPVLEVTGSIRERVLEEALKGTIYGQSLTNEEIDLAVLSLKDGNQTAIRPMLDGERKTVILVADRWGDQVKVDYLAMQELGLTEAFDEKFQIAHQSPENEKMIEAALRNLARWGFDDIDVNQVRSGIYYDERGFLLHQKKNFGQDKVDYKIKVEWREGMGEYFPSGYLTSLQKDIILPTQVHGGIPVADLERRFAEIDWSAKDFLDPAERRIRLLDTVENEVQQKVDKLLVDLAEFARYEFRFQDGLTLEGKLFYKFWAGTPNESNIPNRKELENVLTTKVDIDLFSYMAVSASDAYKLLNGRVIHTAIQPDLGPDIPSFGYIVLKDTVEKGFGDEPTRRNVVQWVDGISEFQVSRELERIEALQNATASATREMAKTLMGGDRVFVTRPGEPSPTQFLLLGQVKNRIELIQQPITSALDADTLNIGQGNLFRHLHKLGFDGYETTIERHLQNGNPCFTIEENLDWGDNLRFKADLKLSADSQTYEIIAVRASLLLEIMVPDVLFKELAISTSDLEQAMHRIDWTEADYYQRGHDPHDRTPAGEPTTAIEAYEIFENLETLYRSSDWKARWTAEALSTKYFLNTPNEGFLNNREPVAPDYEISHTFEGPALQYLTKEKMYNLIHGRSVLASVGAAGREEWYKVNFSGLAEHKPTVLEKIPVSDFWEPLVKLHSNLIHEGSYESAVEGLQNGHITHLRIRFDQSQYDVPVYADPVNNRLVFRFDVDSPIGRYLSEQPGWSYEKSEQSNIGQLRNYTVHPVAVNMELVQELKEELADIGFTKDYEEQLKVALRVGYPEFSIHHQETNSGKSVNVNLRFEVDTLTANVFLSEYDLSYLQEGSPEVKLSPGSGTVPLFHYQEAVNIAAGRSVYIPPRDPSYGGPHDYWYSLDRQSTPENGVYAVKKEVFPVKDVAALIEKLPLKGGGDDTKRMTIIQEVIAGNLAPVTYQSAGKEMPGYIFFDLERQKIRFLAEWEVNPQSVSRKLRKNDEPGEANTRQTNGRKP